MHKQLIGVDEAGYGPNLGPLTIGLSSWSVPGKDHNLYRLLAPTVCASPRPGGDQLTIADSKLIHRTDNLANLELPVLAIIESHLGRPIGNFRDLLQRLTPQPPVANDKTEAWSREPFGLFREPHNETTESLRELLNPATIELPLATNRKAISDLSQRFRAQCQQAETTLTSLVCLPIFPLQFNRLLDRENNKGNLLTGQTLRMLARQLDQTLQANVQVDCDKHGGRNRYAALLQQFLGDRLVTIVCESRQLSEYVVEQTDRQVRIRFQAGGEANLATALGSMVAKYLREVSLHMWNRFWQQQIPGLRPTKGYPQDAKRFLAEIEVVRQRLNVPLDHIWRKK